MPTTRKLGGSQNLKVLTSQASSVFYKLTGLDNSGRVLQNVFITIVKDSIVVPEIINFELPIISTLNNRLVNFYINLGEFGTLGYVSVNGGQNEDMSVQNLINGNNFRDLKTNDFTDVSYKLEIGNQNNWIVNTLKIETI
jgi:hypothetical protein